jgi:hypothetical protein
MPIGMRLLFRWRSGSASGSCILTYEVSTVTDKFKCITVVHQNCFIKYVPRVTNNEWVSKRINIQPTRPDSDQKHFDTASENADMIFHRCRVRKIGKLSTVQCTPLLGDTVPMS